MLANRASSAWPGGAVGRVLFEKGDQLILTTRYFPPPIGKESAPEVSSSPSVVHDHTFAATWRVVGGCCFYEGKGPLVRSWGSVRVY